MITHHSHFTHWIACVLAAGLLCATACTALAQYAPGITTPPVSQVLATGLTMTLSVTATGSVPLIYKWFKNGGMVLEATNSALTHSNAGVTNSGVYYVAITNAHGMRISTPVTVTVGGPQLLAWGYDSYGQSGEEITVNRSNAVRMATNVVTAAAGHFHSIFLTGNCALWAVGYNRSGQLGDGTWIDRSYPVYVTNNVAAVAAGDTHSLFLKDGGELWAMGYNASGQLGDGTNLNRSYPVYVTNNVAAVAAGESHSLFLKGGGELWAMGNNASGQLGDGTVIDRRHPVYVTNNVAAVAAGGSHSLFLKGDGTLWAMGYNSNGQLGDGTVIDRRHPVYVTNNVAAVAAGAYHSLFLKSDGTLWAMGYNNNGQLGDGSTTTRNSPVFVPGMSLANIISGCTAFHTLAVGVSHPPVITSHPTNQTVLAGSTVTFTVTVSGIGPLTYQWYFNGGAIGGALATNCTITEVTTNNTGNYMAVVSGLGGCTNSSVALLTVVKGLASVVMTNLSQTYDGSPKGVTATTSPTGLTVVVTYAGATNPPNTVGSYAVTGTVDDVNWQGSTNVTLTINQMPSSVTVTSSVNPSVYLNNVTFTATVSTNAATGTATFYDDETPLGTDTLVNGVGTFTTSALNVGEHYITAEYSGDANHSNSISGTFMQTVANALASVNLSGLNQTCDDSPRIVTATTSPTGLAVMVTYNGSTNAPIASGRYAVTGTVDDVNWQGSTNGTLVVTLGMNLSSSLNPSVYPSNVTFTATVSASAATGTVTFKDGAVTLGSNTLTNSTATFAAGNLDARDHYITAEYNGSTNYSATTSTTLVQHVTKALATVILTGLSQTYDGSRKSVAATTSPSNLNVVVAYDGSASAPYAVGSYAVIATVNETNWQGSASGTLTVTKVPQDIAFAGIAPQPFAGKVSLSATASSGLDVSFRVGSGPGTIAGSTNLTFTGTGTVAVVASQAGNETYGAAPDVTNRVYVYAVTPDNGPFAGGNMITIAIGNHGTVTNVRVGGVPATITGVTTNDETGTIVVTNIMPATGSAGVKDIVIQTSGNVTFTLAGAYTVNPAGQIGGSTPGPRVWRSLGNGVSGSFVSALALAGTNLYAGGSFTIAGVVSTNGAMWNGTNWSGLGLGMNDTVTALACHGTNLYAGGYFSTADGVAANYVAMWNGTTWKNLGVGMNGSVSALVCDGARLYAGGTFTTADGAAASRVAMWNGTNWTGLGSGMLGSSVMALAHDGTNLYAGGDFTKAGGVPANRVAMWNGASWTGIGSNLNGTVYALALDGRNLYAGGDFTNAGAVVASRMAMWNGASWTNLGSGMNGTVRALALAGTNLYAGGYFTNAGASAANYVALWNGAGWTNLDSGVSSGVRALAYDGANLYVGGYFTNAGAVVANDVAMWAPTFILHPSVTPAMGSATGGYAVVISGAYLGNGTDVTNVTICGVNAAFQSQDATQIVVTAGMAVSAGSPGDVRVSSTSYGETVKSNAFTYLKADQTITFPAIGDKVADDTVGLAATASSGLPVSFGVLSGPGSIDGARLTFTNTGTVVVVASQAGNAVWNPAPSVTNSIVVRTAPLQVQGGESFGIRSNEFGFTIIGSNNLVVVVEACTNLINPLWSPVVTSTISAGGWVRFDDPQWTNYSIRFYRLHTP